jgi:ATP-dependent metalloprotease
MTAYHEGGHALVAYFTEGAMPLHKATVIPRGQSLGMVVQLPEMDKNSFSRKEYRARLDVCMGGRVAEELIYGKDNVSSGAQSDLQQATDIARGMIISFGMSDKVGPVEYSSHLNSLSQATKQLIEDETKRMLTESYERAKQLLINKRPELERLAKALVEKETLNFEEIENVISKN